VKWNMTKSLLQIFASLAVLLATSPSQNALEKDQAMEQPVFYRTVKIDGLSIFYRDFPSHSIQKWIAALASQPL
jgi:hypothetical protein